MGHERDVEWGARQTPVGVRDIPRVLSVLLSEDRDID